MKQKTVLKLDKIIRVILVCPEHGDVGFIPKEKTCSLCGEKLVKLRKIFINSCRLVDWELKNTGKHKKNPHMSWGVESGVMDQDLLDELMELILFNGTMVSLEIRVLEDSDKKK